MSVRRVNCPGCGVAINVPVAMTNARCPKCSTVFSPANPGASRLPTTNAGGEAAIAKKNESTAKNVALIGGLLGGGLLLMTLVGIAVVLMNRDSPPPANVVAAEPEETIMPATPEPYREIRKPEEERKRMYAAYRKQARTTVERPLALPQGGVRTSLESMLNTVNEGGIQQLAALHDVTVEEFKEVIKEGDAKQWDTSPRSNATRDGKRVYPKE